jgi:hypothetical protein
LTMNVRAPHITLSLTHPTIVVMMSAFASPASVVRGPLPIHHEARTLQATPPGVDLLYLCDSETVVVS